MAPTADTPRRGRPRAFDDEQVLTAALEVFWRDGYRATSTRALERELGVSQSSLYNTFGSKSRLLDRAIEHYEARLDEHLVGPLQHAGGGLDAIERFFRSLLAWITADRKRGCLVINLMAEDGGLDDDITTRTHRYRDRVRAALRAALQRAADHGEIGTEAIDERTDLLLGMVLGLNIAVRGGAGPAEVEGLLTAIVSQMAAWRTVAATAG